MLVAVRFCGCPSWTSGSSMGRKVVVASSSGLLKTTDREASTTINQVRDRQLVLSNLVMMASMVTNQGTKLRDMVYTMSHIASCLKQKVRSGLILTTK